MMHDNYTRKEINTYCRSADSFWYYRPKLKKNGQEGKLFYCHRTYYCQLYNCGLCGKLGGKRHINHKNDIYGWNLERDKWGHPVGSGSLNLLCMSCYNKVKKIVVQDEKNLEEMKFLRKHKLEIAKCKKQLKMT